jgi:rhodanese/phosphatase family protein
MRDFRGVILPDGVPGHLYLHSMPGWYDPLDDTWTQVRRLAIHAIVCLAPGAEIHEKSPEYGAALTAGAVPCEVWALPVPDYEAPQDEAAFAQLARRVAAALRGGNSILVHCGAGIGRTGTFAVGVLMALGVPAGAAGQCVRAAGSGPERACQEEALRRLAQTLSP